MLMKIYLRRKAEKRFLRSSLTSRIAAQKKLTLQATLDHLRNILIQGFE